MFNILSSLIMLVRAKTRDIAILRTMGASRRGLMKVFMTVGVTIGSLGIVLGLILGALFLFFRQGIVNVFQFITGQNLWDPSVRFLSELPAKTDPVEVIVLVTMALVMSFLATAYPAWKQLRPTRAGGFVMSEPVLQTTGPARSFTQGEVTSTFCAGSILRLGRVRSSRCSARPDRANRPWLQAVGCSKGGSRLDPHPRQGSRSLDNDQARLRRDCSALCISFTISCPTSTRRECHPASAIFGAEPDAARTRASELLTKLGLGKRLDHRPAKLSAGAAAGRGGAGPRQSPAIGSGRRPTATSMSIPPTSSLPNFRLVRSDSTPPGSRPQRTHRRTMDRCFVFTKAYWNSLRTQKRPSRLPRYAPPYPHPDRC